MACVIIISAFAFEIICFENQYSIILYSRREDSRNFISSLLVKARCPLAERYRRVIIREQVVQVFTHVGSNFE